MLLAEKVCTVLVMQSSTLLHMNRFNKTESAIFVSSTCSLLPDDLYSYFVKEMLYLKLKKIRISVHVLVSNTP